MDDFYQIRMKNDIDVLFVGTMYECERWIHTDGMMDVTYEIEQALPLKYRNKKKEKQEQGSLF